MEMSNYKITALCTKGITQRITFECEARSEAQAKGYWMTYYIAKEYGCLNPDRSLNWRKLNILKSYYLRDIHIDQLFPSTQNTDNNV